MRFFSEKALMRKLLPCPFCGTDNPLYYEAGDVISVVCRKCAATISGSNTPLKKTRKRVLTAWNYRVSIQKEDLRAWLEKESLEKGERARGGRYVDGYTDALRNLLAELEQPSFPAKTVERNVDEEKEKRSRKIQGEGL